ncbi:methyltransferase domain-containing protein [Solitalea lacus]|uniref:methyltransferase domain-containing protein n=1 Tax=Solitalea lacus TaxID=2911172 RepID=UPI001EDAE79A|nr:methyltransferase domain-containing protein [Solitalea lacus]UKJ06688.1 class I SAM-dependent methyltransferase [Solitalea lacus]
MSEIALETDYFTTDKHFDKLYAPRIQQLSERHWTPMSAAFQAAGFLTQIPGSKILDIGSGVGKFCLIGGYHFSHNHFYGVEQRYDLIYHAEAAREFSGLQNVSFIHSNFTHLDLDNYDHFYFYNSFYENKVHEDYRIDDSIAYSESLYDYYTNFLYNALDERPKGTRLVTFHSSHDEIPPGYQLKETFYKTQLTCWIKG